jgi:uncharacterized protein
MGTAIITAFVASVLGSLHCATMCGGLVSFTCGSSQRPVFDQVGYHVARMAAYVTLGAIAGHAGQTLNQSTLALGFQSAAAWVAGCVMVVWALIQLWPAAWRPKVAGLVQLAAVPKASKMSSWFALIHRLPSGARGALLGLTTAALPCGWLYAFVATSAGQGSAWGGASLMAAFALGSVPTLVGVGSIVRHLNDKARRLVPHLSAVVLLLLGLTTVIFRAPFAVAAQTSSGQASVSHSCH